MFQKVKSACDFIANERQILKFWQESNAFEIIQGEELVAGFYRRQIHAIRGHVARNACKPEIGRKPELPFVVCRLCFGVGRTTKQSKDCSYQEMLHINRVSTSADHKSNA